MSQLDLPACHFLEVSFLQHHLHFKLPRVKVRSIKLVDASVGGSGSVHVEGEVGVGVRDDWAWSHNLMLRSCERLIVECKVSVLKVLSSQNLLLPLSQSFFLEPSDVID